MKSCFIIGYGAGIGHGAARVFAEAGYQLALFCRNPERSRELSSGLPARLYAADAGQPAQLQSALLKGLDQVGVPEVLIYNAVAFRQKLPSQLQPEELMADFSVNVVGASLATQCLLPRMSAGSLLFTGGGWALYPAAAVASTAIGKAGLRHYALMLAEELQGGPVRAGTLTVMGQVGPGGAFDPEDIGRSFLQMHRQPTEDWQAELRFTGAVGKT